MRPCPPVYPTPGKREASQLIRQLAVLLAVLGSILISACGARLREDPLQGRGILLGTSVENRPIRALVLGQGPDTILIMATIHGNENAGTPLSMRLISHLERHPGLLNGRRVIFLPVTNPDGYHDNRRTNANGVDLNRNFPAENRREFRRSGPEPLSEPESRIVHDLLNVYTPSRIVSMHQPLEVIDWDGPGEELARHMGRYSDLPVNRLGARPGSLGSYAGETLGIPIITLEFPEDAKHWDADTMWTKYGNALLAAVMFPEDVPGTP